MPQIDIKYSNDLRLDSQKIFQDIERLINNIDTSAGVCKSRAYSASEYLHTHCYLRVALLRKPHRDTQFMKTCLDKLTSLVKSMVPDNCYYSVELVFSSDYYSTAQK